MLGDAAVVQDRLGDIIRLGGRAEDGGWQNIRAMGKVNEWQPQGEAGLMVVEGAGTVSAGYRFNLPSALEASFKTLKLRISGNAPAQYYINIYNGQGKEVVATGWTDSPSDEREVSLAIPGDGTVPAVPVFPADQVTWFSPETEKELFRNTLRQTRHRGCNSTVMLSVAKARLSMLDAPEDARNYYRPEVQAHSRTRVQGSRPVNAPFALRHESKTHPPYAS